MSRHKGSANKNLRPERIAFLSEIKALLRYDSTLSNKEIARILERTESEVSVAATTVRGRLEIDNPPRDKAYKIARAIARLQNALDDLKELTGGLK